MTESGLLALATRASAPLTEAGVRGFASPTTAIVLYLGSFLWFLVMTGVDVGLYLTWDAARVLAVTMLILNSITFMAQTLDVLYLHFRVWPLTSIHWTTQLAAIALTASLVPLADGAAIRTGMAIARTIAQSLFTASQFSVTLEYLWRQSARRGSLQSVRRAPRAMHRHAPSRSV